MDDIQAVEKLPLVLVDALDLDVDKCILINFKVQRLLQEACKLFLGGLLHLHPLGMQLWILLERQHAFEFRHVRQPLVGAKILGEDCAQCRVGTVHPTAGCHAVGHVHDLVRCAGVAAVLVELGESFLLDDLSVKRRHAIHLVGTHDGQVAHADFLDIALFKDAQGLDHGPVTVLRHQAINPPEVYLANDLDMTRQHAGHHLDRPFLQCLGHHSMVGVVEALCGQVPCFIPSHTHHVNQQAHELRHSNGRVRVVHLHSNLLRQIRPLVVGPLDELPQQVLQ
mmetsp:Transcript_49873/g.103815  ORF Transcript_49873/g.103815 Transcript_49873/m.103815 type:complete len:281 (+) Transcript_49873:923-1765(+)